MTHLTMNGTNLGDDGMNYLIKALNYGLEDNIRQAKEMEKPQIGKFIASGPTQQLYKKDYTILPKFQETVIKTRA